MLCTAQIWLRRFPGLAFFSSSAVLLEQHRGQKHSLSSGCYSSVYFLKTRRCISSKPKGLHSVLIRGRLKSGEAGLFQES